MSSGWVAASVRARAMARRRVGTGLARRVAAAQTLGDGVGLLRGTAFGDVARTGIDLTEIEHGIRAELLWELRVLAGWLPAAGVPLARALAARFELRNIEAHRDRLAGRAPAPAFLLGALATSWSRLSATRSMDELRAELAASPWGDPGDLRTADFHDVLFATWLRMVAGTAGLNTVRSWCAAGAGLLVARTVAVLEQQPSAALVRAVSPLAGRRWTSSRSLDELRATLAPAAGAPLATVAVPEQLWRAEALQRTRLERQGFRMLQSAPPGPEPFLGALAVLAVDAWRLRAALAAAAAGSSADGVLDAAG